MLYKKGEHAKLSPHFNSSEFDCPCKLPECTTTTVDPTLVSKLEAFRKNVNAPIHINSGFRCRGYQEELRRRGYETAVGTSQHELGRAADVMREDSRSSGATLEPLARAAGFRAVGVGNYWIHVDLRSDKDRRWEYATK